MKIKYLNREYEVENDFIEIDFNISEDKAEVYIGGKHVDTYYLTDTIENIVRDRMKIIKEADKNE